MPRTLLLLHCVVFSVFLAGCATQEPQHQTPQVAADQKTEVHTIGAEYFCKNGKVGIRLIGTTGIKELDAATLQFLIEISDSYPNLQEGETMPYPAEKMKLLDMTVTGK